MLGRGVLLLAVLSVAAADHTSTLRLVHLIGRHGQRTPVTTYPTDPHLNETFSPFGRGALTNVGKQQQYNQGRWLRERYGHFLGERLTTDLVEAWTTDVDRAKMSAALMLAGLLPPVGDQIWNKDLLWQPVPTTHQTLAEDKLLLVRGCPRYAEAFQELLHSDQKVQEELKHQQDLYQFLTSRTGMTVSNPDDVQDVYSTLKAEADFGLSLPDWTKSVYPEKLAHITAYSFVLNSYNDELKRLKGGPLLKKVLTDSKDKTEGKLPADRKLYVYLGHDSTVANFLQALNVWDPQIPVYSILSIVELHELENKDFGIKVLLRNTTENEPYVLKVPGCQEICPLKDLFKITQPVIPQEIDKECDSKNAAFKPPKESGP